jgi:hypothetical protein
MLDMCCSIHLRFDDIAQDCLVIRCSKFRRSRIVPLHDTARVAWQAIARCGVAMPRSMITSSSLCAESPYVSRTSRAHSELSLPGLACRANRGCRDPRLIPYGSRICRESTGKLSGWSSSYREALAGAFNLSRTRHGIRHLLVPGFNSVPDAGHPRALGDPRNWSAVMTLTAPHITSFLQQRLPVERYAISLRRLRAFCKRKLMGP